MLYIILSVSALLIGFNLFFYRKYIVWRIATRKFQGYYNRQLEAVPEFESLGNWGGQEWFAFKNPLEISTKRGEMIEMFAEWSDLNMTPDYARKRLTELIDASNKGNLAQVQQIAMDLINRTELAAHESILIMLACSMFIIKGENPKVPESKYFELKKQIIRENEEAKAFFLTSAFLSTKNLKQLSETDFLKYLKMQEIQKHMGAKNSRLVQALSTSPIESKPTKQSLRTSLSQSKKNSKTEQ